MSTNKTTIFTEVEIKVTEDKDYYHCQILSEQQSANLSIEACEQVLEDLYPDKIFAYYYGSDLNFSFEEIKESNT